MKLKSCLILSLLALAPFAASAKEGTYYKCVDAQYNNNVFFQAMNGELDDLTDNVVLWQATKFSFDVPTQYESKDGNNQVSVMWGGNTVYITKMVNGEKVGFKCEQGDTIYK